MAKKIEIKKDQIWIWAVVGGFFIWMILSNFFFGMLGAFVIFLFLQAAQRQNNKESK